MTKRWLGVLVLGLGVTTMANAAAAQPSTAPPVDEVREAQPDARTGLFFGLTVGRGSIAISCDLCDNVDPLTEALSYSAHGGIMLTPSIGVLGEYWSIRYNDRGSEWFDDSADHLVAQKIVTGAGQLWLGKYVWLRGGLGIGRHISDSRYARVDADGRGGLRSSTGSDVSPGGETDNGGWSPAATMAVGFELAHTTTFAADVQVRVGTTRRAPDEYQVHNTGIVFGASWY